MKTYRTIILAILLSFATSFARAEKILTAIPQANLNYLSIYVADAKGFFKDEGLENETVVISGPLSIAALLSGDVDFSGAGGSGMRAALKGAPLKGIYFQSEKVTFYLVADPSIKSAADLKGKKVAIGSAGDTQDRMITMFAERGGVTSKDIIRIAVGADTWRSKPATFRVSSPPREKSATILRRLSAGSKVPSAASCSCAIGPKKPSISASRNFSSVKPRVLWSSKEQKITSALCRKACRACRLLKASRIFWNTTSKFRCRSKTTFRRKDCCSSDWWKRLKRNSKQA